MPTTGEAEWQALREPLLSGWLTQGPKVAAFEKAFAERHEAAHAIATTSCTTALHLILAALDIEPGDEVIVPAFTWVATANVVAYCGATPVLADVDRTTFNLDPQDVARRITERTRAVIPVHLFGLCADMHAIAAAAPGLTLIEDAACAVGSSLAGQPAGTLGTAGAFSFHPRKSITTGEGGMVTTNDAELAERIDMLRNHGANVPEERRHHNPGQHLMPEFNMLGFNYRMTDLQGAVGLVQIEKLDDLIDERRQWADYYCQELADVPWLQTPQCPEGWRHGWQAFVCYVDETSAPMPRNEIMEQLQARGVSTRPGTHAVHMLGYYANRLGLAPDDLPAARDCSRYTMAIPLHNRMSADDFAYVVKQIREL
ncbi:MAG: DegT/DnrJ/EryC1/StrS family aminotransferase [Lentisphaeria bacterium]|nr:DegT/DnrJ/EryC1/StrS family aminotransferase [Lentisphaeria bacterium]